MMSFEERSKLGIEKLSEQPPITLDEAKEQVRMLKEKSYTPFCNQAYLLI